MGKTINENKLMLMGLNITAIALIFNFLISIFREIKFLLIFFELKTLWYFYSEFYIFILFSFVFAWFYLSLQIHLRLFRNKP